MRKQSAKTRLMVLATALLLVWVSISCKSNNRPSSDSDLRLERPPDTINEITNAGGLLRDDELNNWNGEMIQIRLLAVSEDGGYRRSPVIATFGNLNGKKHKILTVMEKRFGRSGERDVAIDGNSRVQLMYQYSQNSGNNFGNEFVIGPAADEPTLSRGAPVVFVGNDDTVGVVAAAGGGMYGNSEIKITKATAGSSSDGSISWSEWSDLTFAAGELDKVTNKDVTNNVNKAILAYINQKMGGTIMADSRKPQFNANAFYLKSGLGGVSGNTWVLAITALDINLNTHGYFGILVLYSEDSGTTWKFGPYAKPMGGGDKVPWYPYDASSDYRESQVVAFDGSTVTVVAAPNTIHDSRPRAMYSFSGSHSADAELQLTLTGITEATGGIGLAQNPNNNSEYYLINTRKRVAQYNKVLTIAKTTLDMTSGSPEMRMTGVSGVGSVAVLGDGSLVTIAEEAFAEGSALGETKFNIVQRRFTPGYMNARQGDTDNLNMIREPERYYNPGYDVPDMDN
ncbi:hypothetical protein [Brachyspira catarrhinii]|uniref:Exo-alpha-sialidase n=1 Tax=Brachyspira catarrhinii TaxID=2528966 RepID=A0ABY2TN02_9SPIR|nr:hypothetical protein [Brachyspira catarrhinii]TKZ29066.1 hypothetical protein EZH24_11305 [Brachyspira catarrhinii]